MQQGAPAFSPPGLGPQQGSPMFPQQMPSPYVPVQTNGIDINAIMNLMIIMIVMVMMMSMMKGMFKTQLE
jgi:hypothetical protein